MLLAAAAGTGTREPGPPPRYSRGNVFLRLTGYLAGGGARQTRSTQWAQTLGRQSAESATSPELLGKRSPSMVRQGTSTSPIRRLWRASRRLNPSRYGLTH